MSFNPQVDYKFYDFENYVSWDRWQSYYAQIKCVSAKNPNSILVVGPGDGVVVAVLKSMSFKVKTLDIDAASEPDYLASIDSASSVVNEKFDLVLCCQVLEHLPYDKFSQCLIELRSITRRHLVLALPYRGYRLGAIFSLHKFEIRFLQLVIPRFHRDYDFDGQHYWELGDKSYSKAIVRSDIEHFFVIEREYFVKGNSYHYVFELVAK